MPPSLPFRVASAAALAVAAVGSLASCAPESAAGETEQSGSASSATEQSGSAAGASGETEQSGSAAGETEQSGAPSGTWTETGDYQTPGGQESVTVTLTAKDGVVTAVEVTGSGGSPNSQQYQTAFISGISAEVVGKQLSTLDVGAVSGSSLTGRGFDAAVEKIRADAA